MFHITCSSHNLVPTVAPRLTTEPVCQGTLDTLLPSKASG
jgi:hypothetical protein